MSNKINKVTENKKDQHLNNCIRQIRDELIHNKPVKALFAVEMLERHLFESKENE